MGLGECLVGAEEKALVLAALERRQLFRYYGAGLGDAPMMAATLEREFAQATGCRFALGVTSGTGALEVALGALGIGPGDEVIVPVWSWVSCFTAVVRVGARPVLAEVDDTLCVGAAEIARIATPRTKAVIVVHYQGVAADLRPILEASRAARIAVVEDCAESAGASYHGKPVGSWGAIGVFSFQARKVITAGEGGMVVTNDPVLYERAVRMSDLGQYRAYHEKLLPPTGEAFAGGNYRMSELTAAVALAQLRRLPAMVTHLRGLRQRLLHGISGVANLTFRRIPDPDGDLGFETYLYLPSAAVVSQVRESLGAAGVNCTQHTGTYCHFARPYCRNGRAHAPGASPFAGLQPWPAPGYREIDFPYTRALIERMIAIPIGVLYGSHDVDYIAAAITTAVGSASRSGTPVVAVS